ncbi:MAG TPA: nuclear transport factor 2 family protein [Pyrinomonadaceae bacterium]|nr:nuclear transport factor 2 family protein [Pyrinomonadaceae bacterium]
MDHNNVAAVETLSDDARDILDVSEKWAGAIVANDAEAIGGFMASDWIMVSNLGICDKPKFLSFVESGDLTHASMDTADLGRIKVYGDFAVTASRVTNTALYRGQTFVQNEWTSDVFRKIDGERKCVLTHITPVLEDEPAKGEERS